MERGRRSFIRQELSCTAGDTRQTEPVNRVLACGTYHADHLSLVVHTDVASAADVSKRFIARVIIGFTVDAVYADAVFTAFPIIRLAGVPETTDYPWYG